MHHLRIVSLSDGEASNITLQTGMEDRCRFGPHLGLGSGNPLIPYSLTLLILKL